MTRPARRARVDHRAAADQLRAHPGQWVTVGTYRARASAESTSHMIRTGRATYGPRGAFTARVILTGDETRVEGRYDGAAGVDNARMRSRSVSPQARDRARIIGQIARGEVRSDADAARAIVARHEAAYGAAWAGKAAPDPDTACSDAVAALTSERGDSA